MMLLLAVVIDQGYTGVQYENIKDDMVKEKF